MKRRNMIHHRHHVQIGQNLLNHGIPNARKNHIAHEAHLVIPNARKIPNPHEAHEAHQAVPNVQEIPNVPRAHEVIQMIQNVQGILKIQEIRNVQEIRNTDANGCAKANIY
jgi:hypothetical protein